MYKVKIINYEGLSESCWIKKYKIGTIVEVPNNRYFYFKRNFKVLEHYKIVRTKVKCKKCGHETIKRRKVKL